MAKIKKRRLRWNASPSAQVVGYKLYWSESGGVDYASPSVKLGNVTEVVLPDEVKALADVDGPVELGIAAIDEVGNESDLITIQTPYQFKVPQAPTDLRLEAQKEFHAMASGSPAREEGSPTPAAPVAKADAERPAASPRPDERTPFPWGKTSSTTV